MEWLGQRKIEQAREKIIEIYKQDTYGGETPYETFDMFLTDLEQGDIEKASKYFISKKQDEYKKQFLKIQADNTLDKQIKEWKEARKTFEEVRDDYNNWQTHATIVYIFYLDEPITGKEPDGKDGFIEYTIPAGKHKSEIIFDFNEYSEVWKITLL